MKKLLFILGVILGLSLAFSNGYFLRALQEESSSSEESISELSSSSSEESISEPSDLSTVESISELSDISSEESEEDGEGSRRLLHGTGCQKPLQRDTDGEDDENDGEDDDNDGECEPHTDGEDSPKPKPKPNPKLKRCKNILRRIFRACKKKPDSKKCSFKKLKGRCLEFGCRVAENLGIYFPECHEEG